jgi:hypothetical protein
LACWFQYLSIEMSWSGQRPLRPDPRSGNVIPVDDHGILYVSQSDLNFQHYFVVPGVIFGAVGITLVLVARVLGASDLRPRNPRLERLGTVAEIAFLVFIPVWLFANPFEALARVIVNPAELLLMDMGAGLLWLGWWTLMQHGAVFNRSRLQRA